MINLSQVITAEITARTAAGGGLVTTQAYTQLITAINTSIRRLIPTQAEYVQPVKIYSTVDTLDIIRTLSSPYILKRDVLESRDNRFNPPSLHWLDVTSALTLDETGMDEPDKRFQPSPYGDNKNVLDDNQIHSVDVEQIQPVLSTVGRLRFDTILVRNLMFVVNLYRSVRTKLHRDLVYNKDIIMKSAPITRASLTEFYGNVVDANREPSYNKSTMWNRYNY